MTVTSQQGKPGTLADVIQQVTQALSKMGFAVPVQVGRQYRLKFGSGTDPKVLFVPDVGGTMGPPIDQGKAGSHSHGCDVFVRGKESGEDIDRFVATYALSDLVMACIAVACTGRIEWGEVSDDSPLMTDGAGAGLGFRFTYRRDIRHEPKRWALPPADASATDTTFDPPDGDGSGTATFTPTSVPKGITP
jgi:hypothetical protein